MKKLLFIAVLALFIGCSGNGSKQPTRTTYGDIIYEGTPDKFESYRYRGYRVISRQRNSNYSDREFYTISNDSIMLNIVVPSSFSDVYRIGDTIR